MELKVEGLSKTYGRQKAVDNISFRLGDGELLGFLGPNGAGKSTTMRILSCFMAPDSGNVLYNGSSIFEQPAGFKAKIGYLPENNPLYPDMYIIDYLDFVASLQGVKRQKRKSRIGEMIDYCGLEREKHKKIGELSKGYRQRVGLAQAMIHDPELLILDEPTSGLDPNQIIEIREFIKKMGKEKAIILSTHILPEVEASCERVVIINKGKIVADDSSSGLKERMKGQSTVEVEIECDESPSEVIKALEKIPGTELAVNTKDNAYIINSNDGKKTRAEVSRLCGEKNWSLLTLHSKEATLEDVFREITR